MFARYEHSGEIAAILLSILLQNNMQNSVSTILQAKSLYVNAALFITFNLYILEKLHLSSKVVLWAKLPDFAVIYVY